MCQMSFSLFEYYFRDSACWNASKFFLAARALDSLGGDHLLRSAQGKKSRSFFLQKRSFFCSGKTSEGFFPPPL